MRALLAVSASLAALAPPVCAQDYWMVQDYWSGTVLLLDRATGAVVDPLFIPGVGNGPGGAPYVIAQASDVIQVEYEIWAFVGAIERFDLNGSYLGQIPPWAAGFTESVGACYADGKVYVCARNGPTPFTVFVFETNGTYLGTWVTPPSVGNTRDVEEYGGELLVSGESTNSVISRFDHAGNYLGSFHSSNGVNDVRGIRQLAVGAGQHVLAAGSLAPAGVFEYDASGVLVAYYPIGAGTGEGCAQLPNGDVLFTDWGGLHKYELASGTVTTTLGSTPLGHINPLHVAPRPMAYCTAGTSVIGCIPVLAADGWPSISKPSGFWLSATQLPGQRTGCLFYGVSGRIALPWSATSASFLCVKAPTVRMGLHNTGSGYCTGTIWQDWLGFVHAHPGTLGAPFSAGDVVEAQCWYRDPPAPKVSNLSGAVEFTLFP